MTTPTQPATDRPTTTDALVAAAILELAAAWDTLYQAQLATIQTLRAHRRLPAIDRTRQIRLTLDDFLQQIAVFDRTARVVVERWSIQDLPLIYRTGAHSALLRAIRAAGIDARAFDWTDRHRGAITTLSAQYYSDLIARIEQTVRRAQAFLRAARAQARTKSGVQRQPLLTAHGLDTVVYRDQTRHPADSWARAALGAQAITTRNTAALSFGRYDLEAEWFQCTDGRDCGFTQHGDIDKAHNTIRSAEDAETYPVAHFGCIRTWTPRPDLNGRTDIEPGAFA
ncbi:hypothetical protein [Streptomyces sp. WAC08241]|uniref:hypothetical protein n=1 Tax=Streptomyces sp. WAC08241 TaxID=2487421 RepID=UPI000F78B0E0|nr:hypothetical protein [Streptomyces sp. WAC08241]RSS43820.1 hypothetical protein EF906_08710 [Streptomyces sp. WAC08241]